MLSLYSFCLSSYFSGSRPILFHPSLSSPIWELFLAPGTFRVQFWPHARGRSWRSGTPLFKWNSEVISIASAPASVLKAVCVPIYTGITDWSRLVPLRNWCLLCFCVERNQWKTALKRDFCYSPWACWGSMWWAKLCGLRKHKHSLLSQISDVSDSVDWFVD